jgi:hypothetical protein
MLAATGQARPCEERCAIADLEPRIGYGQILRRHEVRQVRRGGEAADDGADAGQGRDPRQLPDREGAERVGDRDRGNSKKPVKYR